MIRVIAVIMLLWAVQPMAQTTLDEVDDDWPDSRYTVHDDGTVTDTRTGLMWAQCAEGQTHRVGACDGVATTHDWEAALTLAADSTFARYDDWRLPNINELGSLGAINRANPAINAAVFPATPTNPFWSSTPYADRGYLTWRLNFGLGDDYYDFRNYSYHVRLVRTSQ